MLSYARSGATLLNRCLGSLPNVVIMSEVNPLGGGWGEKKEKSPITIKEQARQWYNISLQTEGFVDNAIELAEVCKKNKKHLIIRDWSYVNFTPHELNNFTPSNKLLSYEQLKLNDQKDLTTFAFVRDSIDVWISRGMPPVEEFYKQYSEYINELIKNDIKIFKYEDFCQNPDKEMKKICKYIQIPYSDNYKNYNDFVNVNGDTQNKQKSRGIKQQKIKPLARKKVPLEKIKEINNCTKMIYTNKLMGYAPSYYKNTKHKIKTLSEQFPKKIITDFVAIFTKK